MKWLKQLIIYLIIIFLASFVGFIVFMITSDYEPEPKVAVYDGEQGQMLSDTGTYSLLIWNIGYCGLSAQMDFFYDGGEHVRPERKVVKNNLNGIKDVLYEHRDKAFLMLQEVDKHAKRTYGINQFEQLSNWLSSYTATYGKNYDVPFVPVPLKSPMGHVKSGLLTLSKFKPKSSVRHDFPGSYSFPTKLFMLDRCFLVNRYDIVGSGALVLVNTHNSAYDDGKLKQEEMAFLKQFLLKEYQKGNYVIAGGDWNQCPPGFQADFEENVMDNTNRSDIPSEYLPAWTWAYDNEVPTNRRVSKPYEKGSSPTTVIDFYLLSPNIRLKNVNTLNLDFRYSDHQPVELTVALEGV